MPQARRINPRVDFAFKLIFEQHTDLLIGLINAIVSEKDQVTEIQVLNPFSLKQRVLDKLTILDIKAKSVTGTWYNIEIQVTDDLHYDKRTLYYLCKLYSDQIKEGQSYSDLNKAIAINILNFDILDETTYHNIFRIKNDKTNKPFPDLLELHYIELKKIPDDLKKIKSSLDRWAALLAKGEEYTKDTLPTPLKKDKLICKAMDIFETTHFDDARWALYEGRLKQLRDEISAIESAKIRSREEGKQEGLKITAQNMKKSGLDFDTIAKYTGLSLDDIQKL